ncbi:unannotated protein [freshwater metagenome]|uniref:Unannotated protein n=1 Tax=freshwater metagenome TaxID=449393 RepID=A0A6J6TWZ2_9ZZZZ
MSAISRAIARAAAIRSSAACTLRTSPPARASDAGKTRPVNTHSVACEIPTSRGKKYEEHASGTMPRFANTNPNLAVSLAKRKSIGRVMVTPTPTAGPLITPMTGFRLSKIRRETKPPPSRGTPCLVCTSLPPFAKVSPPDDKSAPAQNARPAPVKITTLTLSSASVISSAAITSCIMRPVNALSLSGRFSVMVAIPSDRS